MSRLCWTMLIVLLAPLPDGEVRVTPKGDGRQIEVSVDLPKAVADKLATGKVSQDDGEDHLQLRLFVDGKEGPAMLGNYQRSGQKLVFVPRLMLQYDKTYHAIYLNGGKKLDTVAYKVPPVPAGPPPEVVDVWPTGDVLPANHLRFYIQFSRPMRGGEDIFQHIQLLDRDGKAVIDPWLPDELWDETGTQLTLYIHPGRIKWGVLLRFLLGPVLEPDRTYTLVVGDGVLDADGRKLGKEFRKKFRAVAEDRVRLDLAAWKVSAPKAGTQESLTIALPKSLDHHSAEQRIQVADVQGQRVAGRVAVSRDGRTWSFQPATAWSAQEYRVVVDERLEDPCGNTPVRPFDVDADAPVPPPQVLTLPFRPGQ